MINSQSKLTSKISTESLKKVKLKLTKVIPLIESTISIEVISWFEVSTIFITHNKYYMLKNVPSQDREKKTSNKEQNLILAEYLYDNYFHRSQF